MCVEAELAASSEQVDSYIGDKQLRVSFQIQTLLRKQFSAYWAHKTLKIETSEIRADISTPSTPIAKKDSSFPGNSPNWSR